MRVRILTSIAGTDFSWAPGEVVDMPDAEAEKWCDGERAERVADAPKKAPARRAAAKKTA